MKLSQIKKRDKKGLSPIVGYVILITLGIIMSSIAYTYLKTYVPQEEIDCPDGVSIFVKDYSCAGGQLNITMKNNGKFDLAGYFIRAKNDSRFDIATINLAPGFINSSDGEARALDNSYIVYSIGKDNFFTSRIETEHWFTLTAPNVDEIEITPVRYELINNKKRFSVCKNTKITESITCA